MTDYEHKELTGNLFKNDKRETDAHPHYRGEVKVEGTVYRLSAWLKDGKRGKFMSLALTAPDEAPKEAGGFDKPIADEIPF